MNKVNVCFIADDNYIMQTSVAITSILMNKDKKSKYEVYILCSNISSDNIKKLKKLNTANFKINIIKLRANKELAQYRIKDIPATPAAIYKFSIPNILPDLDKVIYLDGDTIVKKDLYELYKKDIHNAYVGVVKEAGGLAKTLYRLCTTKNVFYFNSGVMLMNLKLMRSQDISEKLIDYRKNGYNELMDQDALNAILKNHTAELPFAYNTQLMFAYIQDNLEKLKKYYKFNNRIQNTKNILDDAIIIHYSGKKKPWKNYDGYEHDLWEYYYYNSPFRTIMLKRCKYETPKNSIHDFINRQKKNLRRYKFMKRFARIK